MYKVINSVTGEVCGEFTCRDFADKLMISLHKEAMTNCVTNGYALVDEDGIVYDRVRKNLSIEDIDLSVRAYNVLQRAGVRCVEDIKDMSINDLLHIRNCGRRTALEIITKAIDNMEV